MGYRATTLGRLDGTAERLPLLALVVGAGAIFITLPAGRSVLVLPLYMPLVDAATLLGLSVVIILGAIDVLARRHTRSLPLVAASAALATVWLPHLVTFPLLQPSSWNPLTAQTSSVIFSFAQIAAPSILVLAFLQRTGPVANPQSALRHALFTAAGFGLVCAAAATIAAPLLPALVVGADVTTFHKALSAGALAPAVIGVVVFLRGRGSDRRLELTLTVALILLVFSQLSGLFVNVIYDARWYASNTLRLLPVAALVAGQMAVYGEAVGAERARVRHLTQLQAITHDLVASLDLEVVLERVVRTASEVVGEAERDDAALAVLIKVDGERIRLQARHRLRGMSESLVEYHLDDFPLLADAVMSGSARSGPGDGPGAGWVGFPVDDPPGCVAYVPLRCGGETVGALGLATRRPRFSIQTLELLQGVADLAAMAIRNADDYRVQGDLLNNMSHELRTPVSGIIAYSDLLLDGLVDRLSDAQAMSVDEIRQNSRQLVAVIDSALDLADLQARRIRVDSSCVDVGEVLREVVEEHRQTARERLVDLRLDPVAPGLAVRADALRFRQVASELVANALKFTLEGSVRIRAGGFDGAVRVLVSDTGVGISRADRELVFEEFRQVDSSSKRAVGGLGIGLAIARRLVHLQGGRMGLRSAPGRGSVFWFTLPRG